MSRLSIWVLQVAHVYLSSFSFSSVFDTTSLNPESLFFSSVRFGAALLPHTIILYTAPNFQYKCELLRTILRIFTVHCIRLSSKLRANTPNPRLTPEATATSTNTINNPITDSMTTTLVTAVIKVTVIIGLFTLSLAIARSLSVLSASIGRLLEPSVGEITRDHVLVASVRPYTQALPDGLWLVLTWTTFVTGYLLRTVLALPNAACLILGYVLSDMMPQPVALTLAVLYAISVAVQTARLCRSEFRAFISLGPGGTPSTFSGFKRITLLAWVGRIDVLKAPDHDLGNGFLGGYLPSRFGHRPIVGGIAPQRQTEQRGSPEVYDYLLTCLDHFAAENSDHLHAGLSFLERYTPAILANCDCVNASVFRTFGCEITHPHKVDGSLHVVLHPDDIRTVIDAGWGERHPLARANSLWTAWFFCTESRPPVPETLAFVYAPRTYSEVLTVMNIVQAGACFVADPDAVGDGHAACSNHHPRQQQAVHCPSVSCRVCVQHACSQSHSQT